MKCVLSSSFKFVFKGLAVDSLRYNVFLVSKNDCVTLSNAVVLSSYLGQYHCYNLCKKKIIIRLITNDIFECINNIWEKRVKVLQ